MYEATFRSIDVKEVVAQPNQRSLTRTTRTQPSNLLARNILDSGIILITASDYTTVPVATLDYEAYGYGKTFKNPGYLPSALVYMLNASTNARASSLTPLPFYNIEGAGGTVIQEYIPRVIEDGTADLKVQIHVRATDPDIDRLFYYYIVDGPPDGLIST